MKLAIVGQDQLAQVTAICCAPHHERVRPHDAEVLWVCYDTPLLPDNSPSVARAKRWIDRDLVNIGPRTKVLLSTQLPVGTTASFEQRYPDLTFAYSPENIRVDHGVEDFRAQARVVIGRRHEHNDITWNRLFAPMHLNNHIVWTDPETAEMIKHCTNVYHAATIALANEFAALATAAGANPSVIAHAMRLDPRIDVGAKLPGAPYSGGHLARDLWVLNHHPLFSTVSTPILAQVKRSNDHA